MHWLQLVTSSLLFSVFFPSLFSMEPSVFFGRSSYFYMWSRRVEQEGRPAAKLCGIKLNRNKNRAVCVCVCLTLSHTYTSASKLARKPNTQCQGGTKQLLSASSLNLTLKPGVCCVLQTLNLSLCFSASLCGSSSLWWCAFLSSGGWGAIEWVCQQVNVTELISGKKTDDFLTDKFGNEEREKKESHTFTRLRSEFSLVNHRNV